MPTTWNDSLKIGVPLIDIQHQQLFDQIDRLSEALMQDSSPQVILKILSFLDMYVDNHFGYEEQCMFINKCPAYGRNQEAHKHFKARLVEIHQQIERATAPAVVVRFISQELRDWFIHHIKGIDAQLASCLPTSAAVK